MNERERAERESQAGISARVDQIAAGLSERDVVELTEAFRASTRAFSEALLARGFSVSEVVAAAVSSVVGSLSDLIDA